MFLMCLPAGLSAEGMAAGMNTDYKRYCVICELQRLTIKF